MFDSLDNQNTIQDDFQFVTPENLTPGMFLGKEKNFLLKKLLGVGGMGYAWLASQIEGGVETRKVVCKVLPAQVQGEKGEMEKVVKTFRLVQPLSHTNICKIYDLKSDPVCGYFFVMAYADGGTLWDWFRSQPNWQKGLPVTQVVEILRPVAQALDHAHEMGVIHRDVKPQNILFATLGGRKIPWLVDFGISAQIHHTATQTLGARGRSGTPAYMAPEQCLPNQQQDGLTDQYALGVLAYQLLSGRLPFDADNQIAIWGQIVYTQAPALTNVPAAVNEVVQRALAKERKGRFASCVEFIDALKNYEKKQEEFRQQQTRLLEQERKERAEAERKEQERKRQEQKEAELREKLRQQQAAFLEQERKVRAEYEKNIQKKLEEELKKSQNLTVPTDCTLEEAYAKVHDGGTITILPGIYQLSRTLEINRNVNFCGSTGRAEAVIIDCSVATAFLITGGSPSFQNLTASSGGKSHGGFAVTGGTPGIFHCVITSRNGTGMYVHGEKANPLVDSCVMRDCAGNGLTVYDSARGEFRNCEINRSALPGIGVRTLGNPTVIGCKIHGGLKAGVVVLENGRGQFNNCEICRNAQPGFVVQSYGNPIVTKCKIHHGKSIGLLVLENGLGVINDCEIYGNTDSGIHVESSGNPTVTGCKIYDGKECGVCVLNNGLGKFHHCEIYGNELSGIDVQTAGNPIVIGCQIHHGKYYGVLVYEGGMGIFNNNSLAENYFQGKLSNWKIEADAGEVKGSGNSPEIPKSLWKKMFG